VYREEPTTPSLYTAYLYPHLPLPEEMLGKIFREAGSFPEDAGVSKRCTTLVGKGKLYTGRGGVG